MINHYARIYGRILSSCLKTFGFGVWFVYFLFKVPAKLLYVHASMFLDDIFSPGYRDVKVEKPIFIIGHPRSGTTFLHTLLTPTEEFLIFKDWELNHPSLTLRKPLQRFKVLRILLSLVSDLRFSPYRIMEQLRKRRDKGVGGAIEDYKGTVELIAQEEELLFLHILDTQFLSLETPLGFTKEGYPEIVFHDEQPHQEKSVVFFKDCLKRQIYHTGKKQVIAKINFSLLRAKTLMKIFPDAKIIYLARSPLETMPSHFSLHQRLLDKQFGLKNIPEEGLRQYFEHRYRYNVLFYKYFDDLINSNAIPEGQILEVRYDSLKTDLKGTVKKMKDFSGLQFSSELEDVVGRQAEEQASYNRKHKNLSLEELGLSEEKIRADFDFVFKRYGFS